ncbi:MAG: TonB-dependent receptor, partial [Burkholderiales bacterium]
ARASYTLQQTTDKNTGELLTNSPKRLGKLNLVAPLLGKTLQVGLEFQYVSARKTILGETGGYGVTNFTLLSEELAKGLELSASIYNVFDKEFSDPTGDDLANIGLDSIRQDGRSYRLKLIYRF